MRADGEARKPVVLGVGWSEEVGLVGWLLSKFAVSVGRGH
jgi:hypothetical protein